MSEQFGIRIALAFQINQINLFPFFELGNLRTNETFVSLVHSVFVKEESLCVFASLRLVTYIQLCTPSVVAIAVSIAASV